MTLVEKPARWIGWHGTSGHPPDGALPSRRDRNPHQFLDPGRSLGRSHLHALFRARSRHRPRHLGLRLTEDRAHGGIRAAGRASLPRHSPRARRASRRLRLRGHRRVPPDLRLGAVRLPCRLAHRHRRRRHRRRHRGQRMALNPVAIDLDGALGDTRPLWDDFLVDAARRYASIAPLDPAALPQDRGVAAEVLDRWAELGVGDWRGALERFAEDRGPVHFRPNADAAAALRVLAASGRRLGIYTDAPAELAAVAIAHLGAGRRVELVEAGASARERLLAALGPDTTVAATREDLVRISESGGEKS